MAPIKNDLEWRLVYVGSADSSKHDQLLDTVNVGPIEVGQSKFVFEAPAPDMSKIPSKVIPFPSIRSGFFPDLSVFCVGCSWRHNCHAYCQLQWIRLFQGGILRQQ